MNIFFYFPSITGLLFFGVYLLRPRKKITLINSIISTIEGGGFAVGISTILFSFDREICDIDYIDHIIIIIGGISLSGVSIYSFRNIIK